MKEAILLMTAAGAFGIDERTARAIRDDKPSILSDQPFGKQTKRRRNGTAKCLCGRTISANKATCLACSKG